MIKYIKSEKKLPAEYAPGTVRIKRRNLEIYEKTKKSWKKSARTFPEARNIIRLFKAHGKFRALIDDKDPRFLKGQLSPKGKAQGSRIRILPNGRKLDKAFSLFLPELAIHDQSSSSHWDVTYKNPGGTYSYLYTLEKKRRFTKEKYKTVEEFAKHYKKLKARAYSALKDKSDHLAVPMYTLLKTYMRIGNEIYYKANGHKGLTTLKKNDVRIKGNYVSFSFLAKDGVPTNISLRFPNAYINRLQSVLRSTPKDSFIFINGGTNQLFQDFHFREAFKRYCGREFYPHIVRSFYATSKVKEFLVRHRVATKEDVRELFLSIAEKLGHKRFLKKDRVWKDSYNVTVNHYVQPELLEKIKGTVQSRKL